MFVTTKEDILSVHEHQNSQQKIIFYFQKFGVSVLGTSVFLSDPILFRSVGTP